MMTNVIKQNMFKNETHKILRVFFFGGVDTDRFLNQN